MLPTDFIVKLKDKEKKYSADETIKLQPGDKMLSSGRIIIEPVSDRGKIKLLSVERSYGKPKYRENRDCRNR